MEKQFYDKYGKEFHCATCHDLTTCVNRPEPLFPNCCEQYLRDRIAELEEQLKNARKETAKKVVDRVEKLGVFDFEAYEEMGFRRYIIAEMALDNILREYGENK